MKDVFIVGSKGIPANYGGFETFVDNLVTRQVNPKIMELNVKKYMFLI